MIASLRRRGVMLVFAGPACFGLIGAVMFFVPWDTRSGGGIVRFWASGLGHGVLAAFVIFLPVYVGIVAFRLRETRYVWVAGATVVVWQPFGNRSFDLHQSVDVTGLVERDSGSPKRTEVWLIASGGDRTIVRSDWCNEDLASVASELERILCA